MPTPARSGEKDFRKRFTDFGSLALVAFNGMRRARNPSAKQSLFELIFHFAVCLSSLSTLPRKPPVPAQCNRGKGRGQRHFAAGRGSGAVRVTCVPRGLRAAPGCSGGCRPRCSGSVPKSGSIPRLIGPCRAGPPRHSGQLSASMEIQTLAPTRATRPLEGAREHADAVHSDTKGRVGPHVGGAEAEREAEQQQQHGARQQVRRPRQLAAP